MDMLKQEDNAEYVLNTEDPNFETDLKNLSEKVKFFCETTFYDVGKSP